VPDAADSPERLPPFLVKAVHVDVAQQLMAHHFADAMISIQRFSNSTRSPFSTHIAGSSPAYMLTLALVPFEIASLVVEGSRSFSQRLDAGSAMIRNMQYNVSAYGEDPFDAIYFTLPQEAFDNVSRDLGLKATSLFDEPIRVVERDEALHGLALAAVPALMRPQESNRLFADHLCSAVLLHLLREHGRGLEAEVAQGGLAPWQLRRAKEYLAEHIRFNPSTQDMATSCDLSVAHFSRSFKRSTGMPPHKWLLAHRTQEAKRLLTTTNASLVDIAGACGFADQSHFTRTFTRVTGMPPGRWRALARN